MTILIYISGLMTALLAATLVFFIHAYKKYTTLLDLNDVSNQHNFERYQEMAEWMDETELDLEYIRENMEKDGYKYVMDLSKNYKDLKELHSKQINNIKGALDNHDKIYEKLYNDIALLKRNLKALGSDPNTISRY